MSLYAGMEWADGTGLCAQVDPEVWFPEQGGSPRAAKAICAVCPLLEPCREYAITHGERIYGVWGGLTESERRAFREPYQAGRRADTVAYPCGTPAAHRRHLRYGEPPCQACLEAAALYKRERSA